MPESLIDNDVSTRSLREEFGIVILTNLKGESFSLATTDFSNATDAVEKKTFKKYGMTRVQTKSKGWFITNSSVDQVNRMVMHAHQTASIVGPEFDLDETSPQP